MTAPLRYAITGSTVRQTYWNTVITADQGPGPFSSIATPPLDSDTPSDVVILVAFAAGVLDAGSVPQVTSVTGGTGLTFARYSGPYEDDSVDGTPGGVGKMGAELWWAHSSAPVPAGTAFTVNLSTPISFASNRGQMMCWGSIVTGCLSPSSPWDTNPDFPVSFIGSSGSSFPHTMDFTPTNGREAAYSSGLTNGRIIYAAGALVGTDGGELGVVLVCNGGDVDTDGVAVNGAYTGGWSDNSDLNPGGGALNVPSINMSIATAAIEPPPPADGVVDDTNVAILLPGQLIFWGLNLAGPTGWINGGTDLDIVTDVGPSTSLDGTPYAGPSEIVFTGHVPGPSDLNTPIGGAGQILLTGRRPGVIFVRYRDTRAPTFFAVELDVYSPGSGSETLRVSDIGYRSRSGDSIGIQVYPALLNIAFDIDRHLGLEPGAPSSAGFGSVVLHNVGQRYDAYTLARNSDSRNIKILVGNKSTDSDRGVLVDPPYAELRPFFGGAALPWTLSEGSLEIPLRDATYWADRPLQTKVYAGTGGYEGGTELAGKPVPVTRGGMDGNHYVQNVPLVQVDTVNLIYQWTDGPGDVQTLYEGGADVFTREANSTNLYSGAPAPGAYRVDVTRGLLQVGSVPVRALTANVSGAFPTAGMKTTAVDIARYVLTELMGQPETELELASWYNADARYPFTAGFFQGPEQVQGLDIVRYLLGSIGARLFTFRNGKLGVAILRKLALDAVPSFTINRNTAIAVDPVPLPAKLDPPPWRWRVGSYRMNLVQASDFDEAINPVRKTHISQEYPFLSVDQAPELKDIWRRPNDPDVVQTALLNVFAAQDLATDMLALWRNRPGLYQVTMPYEQSAEMEIGDVVTLDWPLADLDGGKAGQIVGEQVRSYDGTGKLYVLVA
jgi:hypothetical protein